jgi:transposase-like protein
LKLDRATSKKRRAAAVLLAGGSATAAARAAGVHRTTIERWKHGDVEFHSIYEQLKSEEPAEIPELPPGLKVDLEELYPKALQILKKALEGAKVSASQTRVALDIVKLFKPKLESEARSSFSDILGGLDDEQASD